MTKYDRFKKINKNMDDFNKSKDEMENQEDLQIENKIFASNNN